MSRADLPPDLERVRTRLFGAAEEPPPPAAGSIESHPAPPAAPARSRQSPAASPPCWHSRADRRRRASPSWPAAWARTPRSVRQIFPRYGIPFRVAAGRPLADCPVVRAAMALPRLQTEGYSFRALAAVVKSNYFSPAACGADAETARQAVRLVREANVWEGRENYAAGPRVAARPGPARGRCRRRLRPARPAPRPAGRAALRLSTGPRRCLDAALRRPRAARRRHPPQRWPSGCATSSAPPASGTPPAPTRPPEGQARDLKALAALEEVLEEVALLDEAEGRPLALADVPRRSRAGPGAGDRAGRGTARTRRSSCSTSCRPGPCRSTTSSCWAWPRRSSRGAAGGTRSSTTRERRFLRAKGVDLADADLDASHEMLLFYLAATRARGAPGAGLSVARCAGPAHAWPATTSRNWATSSPAARTASRCRLTEVGTRDLAMPAAASCGASANCWPPPCSTSGDPARPTAPPTTNLAILDAPARARLPPPRPPWRAWPPSGNASTARRSARSTGAWPPPTSSSNSAAGSPATRP